jgi:cytochrome c553
MKLRVMCHSKILVALLAFASLGTLGSPAFAVGDASSGGKLALYCAYCHGADGNATHTGAPRLAGQSAETFVAKMKLYKANQKIYHPMMGFLVGGLTDRDVQDLAAFYAAQPVNQSLQPYSGPPVLK